MSRVGLLAVGLSRPQHSVAQSVGASADSNSPGGIPSDVRWPARAPGSPRRPPRRSRRAAVCPGRPPPQPLRGASPWSAARRPTGPAAGRRATRAATWARTVGGGRSLVAGQRARQSDHHLDRLVLAHQGGDPGDAPRPGRHRLHRIGQGAGRVAGGDADPRLPQSSASRAPGRRSAYASGATRLLGDLAPMAYSTSASAWSAPAPSVPPPWARSSLPPPRPPSAAVADLTSSPARARGAGRPRWWPSPRAGLSGVPPTMRRRPAGRRADRASPGPAMRRSSPATPSARCATTGTPAHRAALARSADRRPAGSSTSAPRSPARPPSAGPPSAPPGRRAGPAAP